MKKLTIIKPDIFLFSIKRISKKRISSRVALLEIQFLAPKNRSQTSHPWQNSTNVNHLPTSTKESRSSSVQKGKKGRRRRKIPSFWQWSTRSRGVPPPTSLKATTRGGGVVLHKERENVRSSVGRQLGRDRKLRARDIPAGTCGRSCYLPIIAIHRMRPTDCFVTRATDVDQDLG